MRRQFGFSAPESFSCASLTFACPLSGSVSTDREEVLARFIHHFVPPVNMISLFCYLPAPKTRPVSLSCARLSGRLWLRSLFPLLQSCLSLSATQRGQSILYELAKTCEDTRHFHADEPQLAYCGNKLKEERPADPNEATLWTETDPDKTPGDVRSQYGIFVSTLNPCSENQVSHQTFFSSSNVNSLKQTKCKKCAIINILPENIL